MLYYEVAYLTPLHRRGMTSANTDPDLVQCCQEMVSNLRRFYGQRLGMVYILHVNWVFWLAYQLFWPLLFATNVSAKFIIVNDPLGTAHT